MCSFQETYFYMPTKEQFRGPYVALIRVVLGLCVYYNSYVSQILEIIFYGNEIIRTLLLFSLSLLLLVTV